MSRAGFDMDGLPQFRVAIARAVSVGLERMGATVQRSMVQTLSGPSVAPVGAPPGVSDGTLRRSIVAVVTGPRSIRVGSTVFYGLFHETGNWGRLLFPKRAQFLLIPLTREARRLYRKANFNIRSLNLKLIPRRGKPSLLVRELGRHSGRGWRWEPLFKLQKFARPVKRPWAVPAFVRVRARLPGVFASAASAEFRRSAL